MKKPSISVSVETIIMSKNAISGMTRYWGRGTESEFYDAVKRGKKVLRRLNKALHPKPK